MTEAANGLTLRWDAVLAICAVLVAVGGGFAVYVRLMISDQLRKFLETMDATFVRAKLYDAQLADTERRVSQLEEHIPHARR